MVRRGFRLKTLSIALVEAGILILVILLGLYVRFAPYHTLVFINQRGIFKVAVTIIVCQFIFYIFDLYDIAEPRSRRELITHILQAVGAACLVLGFVFVLRPTLLLGYLQTIEGMGVVRYATGYPCLRWCWRLH